MFDPPAELHQRFDQAPPANVTSKAWGREHAMLIGGKERSSKDKFEVTESDQPRLAAGRVPAGRSRPTVDAPPSPPAHAAWPAWAATPWQERVRLLRRAAQ